MLVVTHPGLTSIPHPTCKSYLSPHTYISLSVPMFAPEKVVASNRKNHYLQTLDSNLKSENKHGRSSAENLMFLNKLSHSFDFLWGT